MEGGETKKRTRESTAVGPSKKGKRQEETKRVSQDADARPPGVFEFPWGASGFVHESDGWDLRDVFFSSLVDGCSAAIGFPGDRLSHYPAIRIDLSWPLDGETDGLDCVWKSVLGSPFSA
ncbi:hypothetical protein J5N97_026405 [Dioscorea zingiberensis]|uniref:Uncharacterized protein n=1 Tax=Dioscorea zingiberensis TaxID=325984 RepID=A0A9D5H6S3_9LILI|nr:hypothetical protein J5N97_026405 [Dioscorea zingiberensis]